MENLTTSITVPRLLLFLLGGGTSCLILFKLIYILTTGSYKSNKKMTGKTVLITGANRGIGKETAIDMARRRARVIMACRNVEEGQKVAEEIKVETNNENIIVLKLDLSSFKSVRLFCEQILSTEKYLHILINNAAMVGSDTNTITEDGIEAHFATNYFGPFILTVLLLPLLVKSAPARIINLTSLLHFWGRINLADIYGKSPSIGPVGMYSNTKLGNLLFTRTLSKRLEGTGVTVNAVHPGNTETSIANNLPKWMLFFGPLVKMIMIKKVEDGALTTIFATLSDDLRDVSGAYLADCKTSFSSSLSKNESLAEWLWNLSMEITGLDSKKLNIEAEITHVSND